MWKFIKFCLFIVCLFFALMVFGFFSLFKAAGAAELNQQVIPKQALNERLKVEGNRVTTTDEFGETRHNKPKYIIEENCLVPTDTFGTPKRNEGKVCFNKR